jgi:hypothetical protein
MRAKLNESLGMKGGTLGKITLWILMPLRRKTLLLHPDLPAFFSKFTLIPA